MPRELDLDELQGRLMRLQDSPSFPDFAPQNKEKPRNDTVIREKEGITEEIKELQAVKSSLFSAPQPKPGKIPDLTPQRREQSDVQEKTTPGGPLGNGDGPIPGLEEPESPSVIVHGSLSARKEVDIMQQQMKVTCSEIIALKKVAATKEDEARRRDAHNEAALAELLARVKEAEAETARAKAANGYETLLRVEVLEEELKSANQAIDVLENVRIELEADKSELEEYNRSVKIRKSEIEEASKADKEEIARLKNVVLEQSQEIITMQKKQAQLEEAVSIHKETELTLKETVRKSVEDLRASWVKIEELQSVEKRLQSEVVELTGNVEELQAKDELAQQTIVELAQTNQKMKEQNNKLAVELPLKLQAQVDQLQIDAVEAKKLRAKQVRRLERRLEKRDVEISNLRRVWRALLTSHPDINEAAEAAVEEVRELNALVQHLEAQIGDLQEQNEELTINVAITYIRLMLANWRRPRYLRLLEQRVIAAGEDEEQLERLERIDAGEEVEGGEGEEEEEKGEQEEHRGQTGERVVMAPREEGEETGEGETVSPPMTAFSLGVANIPVSSTSFRDITVALSDGEQEARHGGHTPHTLTPRSEASAEGPRMDPVRFKALQEGRAKYSASFSNNFATDTPADEHERKQELQEAAEAQTPAALFGGGAEAGTEAEGRGQAETETETEGKGETEGEAKSEEEDGGGRRSREREETTEGEGERQVSHRGGGEEEELVVEGEGEGPVARSAPAAAGGMSSVPVVIPILGKYPGAPSPRVDIDWAPVQAKIPSLPPSRSSSVSPPQKGGEEDVRSAAEQLEKLRANATEVREWAVAEMKRREKMEAADDTPAVNAGPLLDCQPSRALPPRTPHSAHSTPFSKASGFHPTGIKYTPSPPDIGMLEELTQATTASARSARSPARPAHGWPSASRTLPQSPSSSKPLAAPPRDPPTGGSTGGGGEGGGGGGGWPGLSPDADISKWVMGWLTPASPSSSSQARDLKSRQHGLSRQNLYPQELYTRSPADPALAVQSRGTAASRSSLARPTSTGTEYEF